MKHKVTSAAVSTLIVALIAAITLSACNQVEEDLTNEPYFKTHEAQAVAIDLTTLLLLQFKMLEPHEQLLHAELHESPLETASNQFITKAGEIDWAKVPACLQVRSKSGNNVNDAYYILFDNGQDYTYQVMGGTHMKCVGKNCASCVMRNMFQLNGKPPWCDCLMVSNPDGPPEECNMETSIGFGVVTGGTDVPQPGPGVMTIPKGTGILYTK